MLSIAFGSEVGYMDEALGEALAEAISKGCSEKEKIKEQLDSKVQDYKQEQVEMGAFLKRYITEKLEGTEN